MCEEKEDHIYVNSLVIETTLNPNNDIGIVTGRIGTVCTVRYLSGASRQLPVIYLRKVGVSTYEMFLGDTKQTLYQYVSTYIQECLEHSPQKLFGIDDIKRKVAVWESTSNEDDWRWVLELKNGKFAFLQSGYEYNCFYDMKAQSKIVDTVYEAAELVLGDSVLANGIPNGERVYYSLMAQINLGKILPWCEKEEFNVSQD